MSLHVKHKPILFLLPPRFEDSQLPGQPFFCRHSLLLEGALSSIEGLREALEVRHISFNRPRQALIAEIGDGDQSLPKLVLPHGVHLDGADANADRRTVVSGAEPILAALGALLQIPVAHP